MIFVKISQNFIKSLLKHCLIWQISIHSLWHVCLSSKAACPPYNLYVPMTWKHLFFPNPDTKTFLICLSPCIWSIYKTEVPIKQNEPRHYKTCLWKFPTRSDSNWSAQLQKLAWSLKFWLQKLETLYYLGSEQQRRMRRLIWAFVVPIWHKTHFLMAWLKCFRSGPGFIMMKQFYKTCCFHFL